MDFKFEPVIEELKKRRKIFVSEADLQLEIALIIRDIYPKAKVRLEFHPVFDPNIHIDILVVLNGKWYPIELKYKTLDCEHDVDDEAFYLKKHGAQSEGCYLYLKDIQRIEKDKEAIPEFKHGYTMFLTNDMSYTRGAKKADCNYADFSLGDGEVKTGKMEWGAGSSALRRKSICSPITLKGKYPMKWQTYSVLDDSKAGTFKYVVNEI